MPNRKLELLSQDGLKLRGRVWSPEKPKAVLLLVHGLGEHIQRYDHVAETLNADGFAFLGFDLRGHGNSEGQRGHTPSFELLLDDIFQGLEKTQELFPDSPCFLYGHSLGGNLVLAYVLKRKPQLSGIIASAPLLRLAFEPPAWKQALLYGLNAVHIHLPMHSGLNETHLSRDLNVVRAYRNDPLKHRQITPPLAIGMLESGGWILQHADEFELPLLLIHGDADRITTHEATQELAAKTRCDCSLKIIKGLYHEPHNEPEKQQVLATILAWLNDYM